MEKVAAFKTSDGSLFFELEDARKHEIEGNVREFMEEQPESEAADHCVGSFAEQMAKIVSNNYRKFQDMLTVNLS